MSFKSNTDIEAFYSVLLSTFSIWFWIKYVGFLSFNANTDNFCITIGTSLTMSWSVGNDRILFRIHENHCHDQRSDFKNHRELWYKFLWKKEIFQVLQISLNIDYLYTVVGYLFVPIFWHVCCILMGFIFVSYFLWFCGTPVLLYD